MSKQDNPYVYKDENDNWVITEAGHEYLRPLVTSSTEQVYAFTGAANPVQVAAAMARLSRRDGSLLSCILDEFADADDADALLERVVTGYGDDSVANLSSPHVVVESISNLATKQVEWSRLASYLEQSTRYIFYFTKQADGTYRYYRPKNLPAELLAKYVEYMDNIFDLYAATVKEMTEYIRAQNPRPNKDEDPSGYAAWPGATRAQACDAVRTMLPAATLSTVGIHASALTFDNIVKHLWAEPLPEMNELGTNILNAVRQVAPVFFQRTDKPDRGLTDVAYRRETREAVAEIAPITLMNDGTAYSQQVEVNVLDYWPRDEADFLAHLFFATSDLSLSDLRADFSAIRASSNDKDWAKFVAERIQTYCGDRLNRRHKPSRALEASAVEIEIVGDYGTFRDLQRHRMVSAFEWQRLSTNYGYDVPQLVIDAQLESQFRQAFTASAELYEMLVDDGYRDEAQYAVCMGYRMRYSFVANARELFHLLELRTSPQGHPGYRAICNEIYRQLADIWPNIAAAMKFVNQSDNLDELTRMASERNTAAKLLALGIEPVEE